MRTTVNSRNLELTDALRSQIDRLYGGLARRIEDWPPVQIK